MEFDTVEPVWKAIIDELATLQGRDGARSTGEVVNPICDGPSIFDTATASEAFALEYERSGDEVWKRRTERAIEAVDDAQAYSGVAELRWGPDEWIEEKGSVFVTGTVLDSLWEATGLYRPEDYSPPTETQWRELFSFLQQCRHGDGKFAHNVTEILGNPPPDVQNTTSYALFLLEYANHRSSLSDPILRQREPALNHLRDGQRSDGFWPYIYPSKLQREAYRIPPLRKVLYSKVGRKVLWRGDKSITFGDTAHHCYVLYYLSKAALVGEFATPTETLREGWSWLERKLVSTESGGMAIDFGWEPEPNRIRFCNFIDTSSYFIALATLPLLVAQGIVRTERADAIAEGLLSHIETALLDTDAQPVVSPHEGPQRIRQKIIPALWESTSWKGGMLARYIHTHPDLAGDSDISETVLDNQ